MTDADEREAMQEASAHRINVARMEHERMMVYYMFFQNRDIKFKRGNF